MERVNQISLFFSSTNLNIHKIGISTLLISIALAYVFIHRWNQRNVKGPKSWPFIGVLIELLNNYNRMHDWLTEYFVESKTVKVPLPFTTLTFIADPTNIEHVLKTNFSNYPKGEAFRAHMEELLGDGIFNSDGEMWKQQRKISSLEFASRNLRDFSTTVFRDYALNLSGILHRSSTCDEQIDMQELLMRMTLDSICKVGFGMEIGTLAYELPDIRFANAFEYASSTVTYRFVNPWWRFKRFLNVGSEALFVQSIQVIDEFTYKLIHKRKAELQEAKSTSNNGYKVIKHDLLSRFIELSESHDSNSTDKSLRDLIINFVLAGRDTTAATLSWSIYMLMINPNVAEHIYTELITFEENQVKEMTGYDSEHPKSFAEKITQFASLLSYDSLAKLPYLHATITETLRLYPAVPQDPKGILEDDVLPDGTKVRAGGLMITVPYVMGRMVYNWGPDATSFNPGRWLNEEGQFQSESPFRFTAFQAGPRTCLGKDSAYLQMKMTLAILCRFFNFHLIPNHPVKYTMMPSLTMERGLKLTVTTR
ncbi:cytochrome P450 704B1-like [Papaver somniferum]|uniref:cytochrome P450 704B1-like n=1 Tax=Papaver somniferum TaxID=3469 RepID=UPI000E6F5001|nr:cytochrome P450 704B1-like [Papaver somniferum]